MSSELSILALYGLLIVVTIVIQVMLALPQLGLGYLATARDEGRKVEGVAGRALRCLDNSIVAMALFAPVILILQAKGISTANTLLAAQVFLVARAAYLVVYLSGLAWIRTLIWAVGLLATLYLYILAL